MTENLLPKPTTGRIVRYRGKQGVGAVRAAIVVMDTETWVRSGDVEPLDSDQHVHLWVFTPGEAGFAEYNVGPGEEPGQWSWPPRS